MLLDVYRITPRISGAALPRPTACDCYVASEHAQSITVRSRRSTRYFIAGSATLELLSALRYSRLTQALYIVIHRLGGVRKVLLY